ncbi:IS110 family transposase [Bifidobacterium pseudocatenulatum]|jgi:hypothetical protein|nr:IS110 family transposase [Bifidobacterium pseudocatenulatum]
MHANDIDVWLGLDVGKESHHTCALDREGRKIVFRQIEVDAFST